MSNASISRIKTFPKNSSYQDTFSQRKLSQKVPSAIIMWRLLYVEPSL